MSLLPMSDPWTLKSPKWFIETFSLIDLAHINMQHL